MTLTRLPLRSIGLAVGLTLALAACGSSSSGSSTTSTSDGGSAATTNSTSTSTSGTGGKSSSSTTSTSTGGSTGSGGGTGGEGGTAVVYPSVCTTTTEITIGAFKLVNADGMTGSAFLSTVNPGIGASATDEVGVQFYTADDGSLDGEKTGSFDLTKNGDDNYVSCARCVLLFQDDDPTNGPAKYFFTKSGTLTVDAASKQIDGNVTATLTDVTLIEVTIADDYTTSPVKDATCVHIASAPVSATFPTDWKCTKGLYGDGLCDCGCGLLDPDCADATVGSCDNCDVATDGGCSNGADSTTCPANINPTNNAVCTQ